MHRFKPEFVVIYYSHHRTRIHFIDLKKLRLAHGLQGIRKELLSEASLTPQDRDTN